VTPTPPELAGQLEALCRAETGDFSARVRALEPLPGHAGFSYRFELEHGGLVERLVLRLPPPGVRHEGPADVVRQGRLLRALEPTAVPVPRVRWLGDDERWFGRPYCVVELLRGRTVPLEDPTRAPDEATLAEAGVAATAALAALHALDVEPFGALVGPPLEPAEDVERWDRFAERAAEPELVALVPELRAALLAAAPREPWVGIFHGDYQWSNLLLDGGRLVAVLDWELARAGPVLNDLGWLCVFSDPASWAPPFGLSPVPAPEALVEAYAVAGGTVADIAWYRALAGYKFAIIAALNLMLHRRGKRPDPFYELLAPSVPRLLQRGLELLT